MYADMVFRYFLNCHLLNLKFCAHAHEQTTPLQSPLSFKGGRIGEWFFFWFFWVGGWGVIKSACVERQQDYRANLNMFNVIDTVLHLSSSCLL